MAWLTWLSALLYLTAAVAQYALLAKRLPLAPQLPAGLGLAALACHVGALALSVPTQLGGDFSVFNVMSLTSGLVAALLLIGALKAQVHNLFILVFPCSAAFSLIAYYYSGSYIISGVTSGQLLHITLSILAYSLLLLATAQSVLFYLQERLLKQHRTRGLLMMLPPMQTMEQVLFQLLALGTLVLTGALLSGLVYVEDLFAQHLVHKTFFSFFSWLVFVGLLLGHKYYGWRGLTAVRWTTLGAILLLLGYFGSRLVLEVIIN